MFGSLPKLREKLGDLAPSLLPAEYGGDTPLREHTAQWAEHLERIRPTLLDLDTMKVQPKVVSPQKSHISINPKKGLSNQIKLFVNLNVNFIL